jgi:hypothetical protein
LARRFICDLEEVSLFVFGLVMVTDFGLRQKIVSDE